MRSRTLTLALVAGLAALASPADAAQAQPVTTCEAEGPARPVCTFTNPEDLVALPGDEAILVSEYGGMEGHVPGALALLVLETDERRELFRGGADDGAATTGWGDPACPGPLTAAFSPHGIHLSARADGALQLLVVQHGGRESVEYFEVTGSGRDWAVEWRGCVVAPDDAWLNSVAALPGGGFVTTRMIERPAVMTDLATAIAEADGSGYVLEWLPDRGFAILGGSESEMPNGIETSTDGRLVFATGSGEVRRIVRATGEVEARVQLGALDNLRWASDGRLAVANFTSDALEDFSLCVQLESGACPMPFRIVAIDPESMEIEELYGNEGPPMGAGTVGLVIGDELFIGSFAGDRILRVTLR